jgi:hypothetical protein
MKYQVKRVSTGKDVSPCEGAYLETHENWDVRDVSEEQFNERYSRGNGGLWKEVGKNHTVIYGYIARQMEDEEIWVIDINTLEELMAFIDKNGTIIIEHERPNIPLIYIYDGYIE